MKVSAIIPALNEKDAIGGVIASIDSRLVDDVIVGDNGSTDNTAAVATSAGAKVVFEKRQGYGWACKAAMAAANDTDIYLFLDGDGSDDTTQINDLLTPIREGKADMVIGSRVLGKCEPKALTYPQRFGNWMASLLVNVIFGTHYTDLGPFRAIRKLSLDRMNMHEMTYGWTVEMQIKAAAMNFNVIEVPVNCFRRRAGVSKVSGTAKGVILAGTYILLNIGKALIAKLLGRYK